MVNILNFKAYSFVSMIMVMSDRAWRTYRKYLLWPLSPLLARQRRIILSLLRYRRKPPTSITTEAMTPRYTTILTQLTGDGSEGLLGELRSEGGTP